MAETLRATGDVEGSRRAIGQLPRMTIAVLLVTGIVTGLQFVFPSVLATLRRNPDALAAGQWWRAISPLLVHSDGWLQIIVNFTGIALVGPAVERRYGPWRWLVLYLSGGVVGEVAGYLWEPTGAGASIALCGLIGGLVVWQAWRATPPSLPATIFGVAFSMLLLGASISPNLAVPLCVVCSVITSVLLQRQALWRVLAWWLGVVILGGAVLLTALSNNHGPPLLAGAVTAVVLLWSEAYGRVS